MNKSMIFPLVFGLVGTAIFVSLGFWQLQRMNWKAGILAEIDIRLAEVPVSLPETPDQIGDKYLQVEVSGQIEGTELHVLTFGEGTPGFRVIAPMVLDDGRRILVDRGFLPETEKDEHVWAVKLRRLVHWYGRKKLTNMYQTRITRKTYGLPATCR